MSAPTLAELQRQFFRSIAASPGGGAAAFDPSVTALIAPSPTLTPTERLAIYADMYFARLKDCLTEDVPRTVELLGPERWDEVARAFLTAYPSSQPSVRHAGVPLAGFLATGDAGVHPALAELARFEWARLDVFDASDADPLTGADLAAVDPEAWGALRFKVVPAFVLFESVWPLGRLWAGDVAVDTIDREPTVLRIWRQGFMVYHATMRPREAIAMRHVMAGSTFAEVCEVVAADISLEEAAPQVVGWLARWVEDGLLASSGLL